VAIATQYPPGGPPGDVSTATAGDDGIDVGRIITNPNWTRDSKPAVAEPAPETVHNETGAREGAGRVRNRGPAAAGTS
jgi:hypothetical protein